MRCSGAECPNLWINSLWPSDAIWRRGPWSSLSHVMACCLTAPSHYLSQLWQLNSSVIRHSPNDKSIGNTDESNTFENYAFKISHMLHGTTSVNISYVYSCSVVLSDCHFCVYSSIRGVSVTELSNGLSLSPCMYILSNEYMWLRKTCATCSIL